MSEYGWPGGLDASSFVLVSYICGSRTQEHHLWKEKSFLKQNYVGVEKSLFWKIVTIGDSKACLALREHYSTA